ncbi:MAG TPA: hypothetical protein VNR39_04710 [Pseudolabrys sp.]|nr:hypothetical protein [Pseudolabrys sp.]
MSKPAWPFPDAAAGLHLRSIGGIRHRYKPGFEGWIGEDRLAFGINAVALRLPRFDSVDKLGRLRLVRKACFFDGLTNGRFEFLFTADAFPATRELALTAARRFLDVEAAAPRLGFSGTLRTLPAVVGPLWADSTVKHGRDKHAEWIRSGRPICIVESDQCLQERADAGAPPPSDAPVIELAMTRGKKPSELLLISPPPATDPSDTAPVTRGSDFRAQARYVRTYTLRLLQNVESLSLMFSLPLATIDDDRIQNIVNEYTRQINRSRQRIEQFNSPRLIEYCYSAFGRLYPGLTNSLRISIQNSSIRPNVARKLLNFLELSENAFGAVSSINFGDDIHGDKVMGDKVMGDKYGKIDISGQGVAVGRGANATVSQSTNAPVNVETVASSLSGLAELVRKQSGREDADVEASLVEAAAKKAEAGDEKGAAAILKKSASWVLDLAKITGSAVLTAFLKSSLGL